MPVLPSQPFALEAVRQRVGEGKGIVVAVTVGLRGFATPPLNDCAMARDGGETMWVMRMMRVTVDTREMGGVGGVGGLGPLDAMRVHLAAANGTVWMVMIGMLDGATEAAAALVVTAPVEAMMMALQSLIRRGM